MINGTQHLSIKMDIIHTIKTNVPNHIKGK